MLIIPTGSDASIQHKPWTTLAVLALSLLVSISLWIAHPRCFLDGEAYLVWADDIAKAEREFQAWEARDKAREAGEETSADRAADLAESYGIEGATRTPITEEELAEAKAEIAAAKLDQADRADLLARLAACPRTTAAARTLWFKAEPADRPITTEAAAALRSEAAAALAAGTVAKDEHDRILAVLAARRVASLAFIGLFEEVEGTGQISAETRDRLAGEIAAAKGLATGEADELKALLGKHPVASGLLADMETYPPEQVPWYLVPWGAWSSPLRWIAAFFVQTHWRDVLIGLAVFGSVGMVVEGKLGWRRFAPLLAGLVVVTGLVSTLTGLLSPLVLAMAGNHDVVAALCGMLLVWTPANRISYTRWLIVPLGSFDIPVWLLVAFSAVAGLVIGLVVGFPVTAVLLMSLACPALGFAIGTVILRRGWVECDGWDAFSLWRTRHMLASERNQLARERSQASAARPAAARPTSDTAAVVDDDPAPLLAAAEEEVAADIAAGKPGEAFSSWRAVRRGRPGWKPPAKLLDRLAKGLWQAGLKAEAGEVAGVLAETYPDSAADALVILAALAVEARKPQAALRHLACVPDAARSGARAQQLAGLKAKADALVAEGITEVEFL